MSERDAVWDRHDTEWRDTAQVTSHWEEASSVEPSLLRFRVRGKFWETLDRLKATLLVTREYEHLVIALTVTGGEPSATYMRIPHPSGLVYDCNRRIVHLASTRNPNQILELRPATHLSRRADVQLDPLAGRPLVPVRAHFYPGSTYLHDLSLVGGELHANAVGENTVVRVGDHGRLERVFWPRCIERSGRPRLDQNYVHLNSIAAGATIRQSFFSASADAITSRRPGHRDFPVDGRGVIFSGATREPVARGLTRPHSARLHRRKLWVANSGYGEIGTIVDERLERVAALPGWTRGLTFAKGVAFAGTSRVIPRFHRYAPGLDVDKSRCAVHAVDARTGNVLGSLTWPDGNQVFAVDWAPRNIVSGFPFSARARGDGARAKQLFYAFQTGQTGD
ncbi:MAG: hypothetical protein BMS9Abin37_1568 [Acidobacteriota bacterium]|nr:MAG: hypothetical protein BMS9Abin37_1568 [Acidobacteriota bacterium]